MARKLFPQGGTLKRKIIIKDRSKVAIPHANIDQAHVNIYGIEQSNGNKTLLKQIVKSGGANLLTEIEEEDGAYYFAATRAETALWAAGQAICIEAWAKTNDEGSDYVMGLNQVIIDEITAMESKGDSLS